MDTCFINYPTTRYVWNSVMKEHFVAAACNYKIRKCIIHYKVSHRTFRAFYVAKRPMEHYNAKFDPVIIFGYT